MPLTRGDYSPPPAKPEPKKDEPETPDEGGSAPTQPEPTEPPVPVGATPEAHAANGDAKPNGRRKK
jgi:hypothetical protein